ncbi:hypothetical protein ABZS53_15315 [Streptomyces sp. NPDC005499]|uniref:hypothetical protein n=1 Tax=Streptomyces sp. NPDC005499 TaxID=3154883 RepID=UPI0033A803FA
MSNEAPIPVRLLLSFPGSRQQAHAVELPADWYFDPGSKGSLVAYTLQQLLPQALLEAGLTVQLELPQGVAGVTADAAWLTTPDPFEGCRPGARADVEICQRSAPAGGHEEAAMHEDVEAGLTDLELLANGRVRCAECGGVPDAPNSPPEQRS